MPVVEVEQPTKPFAALDRRVVVGRSHCVFQGREQPVAGALVIAFEVIVHDTKDYGVLCAIAATDSYVAGLRTVN